MMSEDKKRLVREFLEILLHSGDVDGALKRTTANAKLLIFNGEVPNGFQMLGGMIPALFASGPTREFTAQWVDGDTVLSAITVRGDTKGGDKYENAYLIICTFEGDKIAIMQEYMDSAYANTKFAFAQQG
jgi:ketosteroid isomerase-like protein